MTVEKSTEYSLWKATRRLKKTRIHNPLKHVNGKWARNLKQKADLFAEHLANVFTPFPGISNKENLKFVNKGDKEEIPLVILKELKNLINCNLSTKKSTRV